MCMVSKLGSRCIFWTTVRLKKDSAEIHTNLMVTLVTILFVCTRETREMWPCTAFCLACWGEKGKIARGGRPLLTCGELAWNSWSPPSRLLMFTAFSYISLVGPVNLSILYVSSVTLTNPLTTIKFCYWHCALFHKQHWTWIYTKVAKKPIVRRNFLKNYQIP